MAPKVSLTGILTDFARTMATDFPIQAILDQLVERTAELLPVDSAGVTLISATRDPHRIAASDASARQFEELQTRVGEGPCIAAFDTGRAIAVPDLARDPRFPRYGPLATAAGLAAVFTFPLCHGDRRLGALDLYRSRPGPLDREATAAAQTLADVVTAYLLSAQARDQARESSNRYRESALHDALTGLPNRVLLHERLHHAVQRASRSHTDLAILFIDLDGFKTVNDTFGHRAGDELLVAVADRLRQLARPGDTVARMAGDEFVLMCEDLDDPAQAGVLAARVVSSLAAPFDVAASTVALTASVGIGFAGPGAAVPEQVLDDADEAMYQAKRAGGARHQLIDLRERHRTHQRTILERDLRAAASLGQLRLDYQPIVRTIDAATTGVEALLRWDHPDLGCISPAETIALAEQSNTIIAVGRWVLERACADLARLQEGGDRGELGICVNVSAHQLMAEGWCRDVAEVLAATGVDAASLTLEITESAYIEDAERAMVVLDGMKELGLRIALDDFGTGYSSLSYLQRFPIDVLKIDRRFIATLGREPTSAAIVRSVIDLAHILGQRVIAEGVENADQHRQLERMGCDACQGFYFAEPMSIDALLERLSQT